MPKLTIRLPGLPPVTHAIGGESVTIGRTPENSIQIADPSVSKSHAKLDFIDGQYHLTDLGSKNGTFVNNQRVREVLIRHSDVLKFANIEVVFEMDGLEEDIALAPAAKPAGSGVTVTAISATPTVISAAAPKAAVKPTATGPSTPATGFLPKPPDAPKARKQLPGWLLPAAGLVLVLLVGAAVYWWLTRPSSNSSSAGGTPATAPTRKTETNAAAPDAARLMAAENARAAEAAALASKPITSSDAPAIGALLRDEKPEIRRNAARALHALGKEARGALPSIRDALKDPDPETRLWSALSLAQLDPADQASVPALIEALKSEDPQLRQVASRSLAVIRFQGDESAPVLDLLRKAAESDENEEVRKAAGSAVKLLSTAAKLANP